MFVRLSLAIQRCGTEHSYGEFFQVTPTVEGLNCPLHVHDGDLFGPNLHVHKLALSAQHRAEEVAWKSALTIPDVTECDRYSRYVTTEFVRARARNFGC
jgi:hypothetical protein